MTSPETPAPNELEFIRAIYVERNPPIENFLEWAAGRSDSSSLRLRSIIGPPGIGKSTFLKMLRSELIRHDHQVFWLDGNLLGSTDDFDEFKHRWFNEQIQDYPFLYDRTVAFSVSIENMLRQFQYGRPPVLLVDHLDALPHDKVDWLEKQLILPFLFNESGRAVNTMVVIARRDDSKLIEPQLRWEEEIIELRGLETDAQLPAEQIRRRLQTSGADLGPNHEPWEMALDQTISDMDLTEETRASFISTLSSSLTTNPYINLLLLKQALANYLLRHPQDVLDTNDYLTCLKAYLIRAGLSSEYIPKLHELAAFIDRDTGTFTNKEYGGSGLQARDLDAFMNCGIVTHATGLRYQLDPVVHSILIRTETNPNSP
jgi:hypothetical protein